MMGGNVTIKVVIVGDGTCGKTSLLHRLKTGEFPKTYIPTVFENYTWETVLENGQVVSLVLVDTAGQEDYDKIRPLSYQDAEIVIFCYDIGRPETFTDVSLKWVKEINYYLSESTPLRFLVGLKSDLRNPEEDPLSSPSTGISDFSNTTEPPPPLVRPSEADDTATRHMFEYQGECSAKTGENVLETFQRAAILGSKRKSTGSEANGCCVIL
ncbi:transforming protein RhoA-like [Convolutriloba macropyga]|uniref:transforming protein RhoA-like n=1 Tax=Convolutriloba macropyga TaxID=536237 RepID=UPI003F51E0FB